MFSYDNLEIFVSEPSELIQISLDDLPDMIDLTSLASRDYEAFESEVIRLSNLERAQRGVHELTRNEHLSQAALAHTMDMTENRFMSHTGSDGSNLATRVLRADYRNWIAIGENVAMGYRSPSEVVQGWMDSPGHRENLLSPRFHEIGVAYVEGEIPTSDGRLWRGGYWTQDFGATLTLDQVTPRVREWWRSAVLSRIQPADEVEIVLVGEQV